MSLGERIYKLRTEKEMSQGDLADDQSEGSGSDAPNIVWPEIEEL